MHARTVLSVGNFFLAVCATLVSYTLISYLSAFIPEMYIGFAIAAGAAIAVASFAFLPRMIAAYGAQRLTLYLAITEMIMIYAVAAAPSTIASALIIVLVVALQPLLYYGLDILLEAATDGAATTARTHTLFLTGGNFGALTAPLLISTLLAGTEHYSIVFFAAATAVVPFVILFVARQLPKGETPHPAHVRNAVADIAHNRDLTAVTFAHFVLYLFYMWAPLYIPVYLHAVLGIPWLTLGWMFSVMLIPYILIEYPAGWVADRFLGDKDLMLAGFLIAGSALAAVSTITAQSTPFYILSILLATRAGAALIESMTEAHFFRCISQKDISSVSIFRGVWPLATCIAPLVASLILSFSGYPFFFILAGGFVVIAGVTAVFFIRDFDPRKKGAICVV